MSTCSPKEISISLPSGRLAGKAWGLEAGHPILALHGWLDNANTFDGIAPLLPNLRLLALDLPGHGYSDHRPPGICYYLMDAVSDILSAADKLGLTKFSLLGHSLGGSIASIIAGAVPDRIERLVLVDSLGALTAEASETPSRVKRYLDGVRALSEKRLPVYHSLEAAAKARFSVGNISQAACLTLASRGTKVVEGGLSWRSDPRLRLDTPVRLTEAQMLALLGEIASPTLLIRATNGIPIPAKIWADRSAKLRNVQRMEVEGEHHVHLDHPERVAPALAKFFERLPS